MPRMFINRRRTHHLTRGRSDMQVQFRWETINSVIYKVGGLVFIIGSILFFPRFEAYADIGAWTFFVGSLLYLLPTVHDLAEVRRHWRDKTVHDRSTIMECTAAASYVRGHPPVYGGQHLFPSGGEVVHGRGSAGLNRHQCRIQHAGSPFRTIGDRVQSWKPILMIDDGKRLRNGSLPW